ncbi:DUF805 domain-containing protein [Bifidobacterium sp. MA2]|uniref:DUF805 domain-containing protein n=1 Tax=Bifidobacterium santillanense TaxID=2809028 RepID=A0ABS5URG2_9BIFI|nr:DUF805 domain-containing protein [Bifidobacterium santillanense]MBT1173502.1 DUF805 domain-containing protein [Bifidobacterium santillanense]
MNNIGINASTSDGRSVRPPLWAPWYGIGFVAAIERFFRKMFVFHGRASRGEYWWTVVFGGLLAFAAMAAVYVVGFAAGVSDVAATAGADSPLDELAGNVGLAIQLLFFIPTISLSVRRLHDQNRSGWWLLLAILPQAGAVVPTFVAGVVNGYTGHDDPAVVVVGILATVGLYVLGSLASVILMVLPGDPRGARFDRPPVDALAGRTAGAAMTDGNAANAVAGGVSA